VVLALLAAGRPPEPAARLWAGDGAVAPAGAASEGASRRPGAGPPAALPADAARDAFARDLAATGRVAPERARALAAMAVRQARAHRLPPALLLGVLLVENEPLDSRAVSSAGARGLMQVHPLWRPLLGPRYGFDLAADSTNLAMGAHILAGLLARARTDADVERGLLRYNGCRRALAGGAAGRARAARPVRCAGYPKKVRRRVEERAAALCPSRSFARCVVRPLLTAGRGEARSAPLHDPRHDPRPEPLQGASAR
jgi:soluble lytic murein transglycosylase-like protein